MRIAFLAPCVFFVSGVAAAAAGADPATWRPWLEPFIGQEVSSPQRRPSAPAPTQAWRERWMRGPAGAPWTELTLELIVKYQQNPLRAARILSLVHAAMHDAVVLAARDGASPRAREAAIHLAAGGTLAHLYPQESKGRLEGLGYSNATLLAAAVSLGEDDWSRAVRAAQRSVAAAIARSRADGAGRQWSVERRPPDAPGKWRASPPINIYNPAEPRAGDWRTWALKDGAELQPPPPVPYDSELFWKEVDEVLRVARALTPGQRAIAERWNLDHGSVTPAGVWNRIALDLVRGLDSDQAARVMAAMNAALMDAFVSCWNVKYKWWTERPVTVIRGKFDPNFLPVLVTPPFPSYISGHATASSAAATTLAGFFPGEAAALQARAQEAADSRLLGGIHYRSDNEEGLKLGRRIGERVLQRALGPST